MISKDKTYRTRDGREVRIYATDGGGGMTTVHGAIWKPYDDHPYNELEWSLTCWSSDGKHCRDKYDLIEVKPRIRRTVWLNLYKYHTQVIGYAKKEDADADRVLGDRACCVKVEIDCEEGEGL